MMRGLFLAFLLTELLISGQAYSCSEDLSLRKSDPPLEQRLRHLIAANNFTTVRDLIDYTRAFGDGFIQRLSELDESGHWIDSGAGEADAMRFYMNLNPGFTERAFRIRGNSPQDLFSAFMTTSNRKTPVSQEIFDALIKIENRSIQNRTHVTAITYAVSEKLCFAFNQFSARFTLLKGRLFEQIPLDEIRGKGAASIITDLYGVFSYTEDIGFVLQRYLDLLNEGGVIYIGPKQTFLRTHIILPSGETINAKKWIESISGLNANFHSKGTNVSGLELSKNTARRIVIPKFELVKTSIFEKPPFRIFKIVSE